MSKHKLLNAEVKNANNILKIIDSMLRSKNMLLAYGYMPWEISLLRNHDSYTETVYNYNFLKYIDINRFVDEVRTSLNLSYAEAIKIRTILFKEHIFDQFELDDFVDKQGGIEAVCYGKKRRHSND